MSGFWKRLLALGFAVILGTDLLSAFYVVPVLTTDVDPNLMKGQCPGGKDWDMPGSSCHQGIIADYAPVPIPIPKQPPVNMAVRKKRGH
jgi:hypothetical protein